VLFVLGLTDKLAELASLPNDPTGQFLEEETLPQRVRLSRKKV